MDIKRKYLTSADKYAFVNQVVASSTTERDGMLFIDYIQKETSFNITVLQYFYDMKLEDIDMDDYIEDNKMNTLLKRIPKAERDSLMEFIDLELKQEVDLYNSFPMVIKRSLDDIMDQLIPLIENMPELLDEVSPKFVKFFNNFAQQAQQALKKIKTE